MIKHFTISLVLLVGLACGKTTKENSRKFASGDISSAPDVNSGATSGGIDNTPGSGDVVVVTPDTQNTDTDIDQGSDDSNSDGNGQAQEPADTVTVVDSTPPVDVDDGNHGSDGSGSDGSGSDGSGSDGSGSDGSGSDGSDNGGQQTNTDTSTDIIVIDPPLPPPPTSGSNETGDDIVLEVTDSAEGIFGGHFDVDKYLGDNLGKDDGHVHEFDVCYQTTAVIFYGKSNKRDGVDCGKDESEIQFSLPNQPFRIKIKNFASNTGGRVGVNSTVYHSSNLPDAAAEAKLYKKDGVAGEATTLNELKVWFKATVLTDEGIMGIADRKKVKEDQEGRAGALAVQILLESGAVHEEVTVYWHKK